MEPEEVIDDIRLTKEEKRAALQFVGSQRLIDLLIDEADYGRNATLAAFAFAMISLLEFVLRFVP